MEKNLKNELSNENLLTPNSDSSNVTGHCSEINLFVEYMVLSTQDARQHLCISQTISEGVSFMRCKRTNVEMGERSMRINYGDSVRLRSGSSLL
jgi:hypothetical protein